jgi:hypothetical protein
MWVPWSGIFFIQGAISVYNYLPYEDLKVTLVCMRGKTVSGGKRRAELAIWKQKLGISRN